MFGSKDGADFCPLIKGECKKEKCKFWRMDDCSIAMFMETQGATFFSEVAKLDELEKQQEEKEPVDYSWLENMSEEQIIDELVNYVLKEFPNEKYLSYTFKNLYWQSKGFEDRYDLPQELKVKIEKAESKADSVFKKTLEAQEKERLEEVIENCYKWAKENNSVKLTKSDVNAYIMEVGESLTQASKDILYSKVNMRLKNS